MWISGSYSQKALWGQDSHIWEDGAWQLGPSQSSPSQWADLHILSWFSDLLCPYPEAPEACPTEQLPAASLSLAMACWRLALLLTGALLAGEPSLILARLGVGWETALAPEGPRKEAN